MTSTAGARPLAAVTIPSIGEPLTIDGFGFDIEMLVLARRAGTGRVRDSDPVKPPARRESGTAAYAEVLGDVLRLRRRFGRVEPSDVNVLDPLRRSDSTE